VLYVHSAGDECVRDPEVRISIHLEIGVSVIRYWMYPYACIHSSGNECNSDPEMNVFIIRR
jgi:hypothetical protein